MAKECTTGFQCEAGDTKLHFLMRDQLGPPLSLAVTLFGDQLGPTYQCDRLSKTTTEKFGWTKRQPRQHPWVKLPAQTRKIADNVEKDQKFSITCIRATYFYQSPYLCWMNKTTNMSNPNNYDSDRPNYIKKLLPKDPYNAPCPERLRNAPQGFFVKQVTLNYML